MLRLYFKTIIKLILCLVVALFVFSIIGLILQSNFDIPDPQEIFSAPSASGIIYILVYFIFIVIITWFIWCILSKNKFLDIGLKIDRKIGHYLLTGVSFGFCLAGLIFIIEILYGSLKIEKFVLSNQPVIETLTAFGYLGIIFLFGAITEEVLHRGLILQYLNKKLNTNFAIFLSSVIFSVFHFSNPGINLLGYLGIYFQGLLYSYMFIRTKSLWLPIIFHFSWNFFLGPVFSMPVSGYVMQSVFLVTMNKYPELITGGAFGPEGSLIGIGIVWFGIIIYSKASSFSQIINNRKNKKYFHRLSSAWKKLSIPQSVASPKAITKGLYALEWNQRNQARRILENLQIKFPGDYRIIHLLALLNYWELLSRKNLATYLNRQAINNPKKSDKNIERKTIANWVCLANSDNFWEAWQKERKLFYFQNSISKNQIDEFRKSIIFGLENKILNIYKNDFILECESVELLKRLAKWGKRNGFNSQILIAGPIMFNELGMLKQLHHLISYSIQIEPKNNDFKLLSFYFSTLGKAAILLNNNKIEDALIEVEKIDPQKRLENDDFLNLYTDRCIVWANQANKEEEKINKIERALNIVPNDKLKFIYSNKCHDYATNLANEKKDLDKAIIFLKKALKFKSQNLEINIKQQLAFCLNQRAIKKYSKLLNNTENKKKYNSSLDLIISKIENNIIPELREAHELDFNNEKIIENISTIEKQITQLKERSNILKKFGDEKVLELLSFAKREIEKKIEKNINWNNAIEYLRKALDYANTKGTLDGQEEIKQQLALCLNQKAIGKADIILKDFESSHHIDNLNSYVIENTISTLKREVLSYLKEAFQLNPNDENIYKNLTTIKQQIEQLRKISMAVRGKYYFEE